MWKCESQSVFITSTDYILGRYFDDIARCDSIDPVTRRESSGTLDSVHVMHT